MTGHAEDLMNKTRADRQRHLGSRTRCCRRDRARHRGVHRGGLSCHQDRREAVRRYQRRAAPAGGRCRGQRRRCREVGSRRRGCRGERQGLSVDGLTSAGRELTDKARAVAERGVEAALGDTKTNEPKAGETKSITGLERGHHESRSGTNQTGSAGNETGRSAPRPKAWSKQARNSDAT